jgi:hypothetical protein
LAAGEANLIAFDRTRQRMASIQSENRHELLHVPPDEREMDVNAGRIADGLAA